MFNCEPVLNVNPFDLLKEDAAIIEYICKYGLDRLTRTYLGVLSGWSSYDLNNSELDFVKVYFKIAGKVSNVLGNYAALKSSQENSYFYKGVLDFANQVDNKLSKSYTEYKTERYDSSNFHVPEEIIAIFNEVVNDNRSIVQIFREAAASNSSDHEKTSGTSLLSNSFGLPESCQYNTTLADWQNYQKQHCHKTSVLPDTSSVLDQAAYLSTTESVSSLSGLTWDLNSFASGESSSVSPTVSTLAANLITSNMQTIEPNTTKTIFEDNFLTNSSEISTTRLLATTTSSDVSIKEISEVSTSAPIFSDTTEPNLAPPLNKGQIQVNKYLSSFGLGAIGGGLDEMSEILLNILERKNCSLNTIRCVATILVFANSFAITTLPFIYNVIQVLDSDNDAAFHSEKVMELTWAFFVGALASNAVLQGLKHGLTHCSAYVSNKTAKFLLGLLPFLGYLWIVANGDNTLDGFALVGSSLVGAAGGKIAVKVVQKGIAAACAFFPTKKDPIITLENGTDENRPFIEQSSIVVNVEDESRNSIHATNTSENNGEDDPLIKPSNALESVNVENERTITPPASNQNPYEDLNHAGRILVKCGKSLPGEATDLNALENNINNEECSSKKCNR